MSSSSTTLLSDHMDKIIVAIYILGIIKVGQKTVRLTKWLWSTFLRRPKTLTNYGSWALVTGPTDGIGKALAMELAAAGLNLILVGRNPEKLHSVSNVISELCGKVEVKVVVMDFAKEKTEDIEGRICGVVEGLDVGVVVNNVGVSAKACYFHEAGKEQVEGLIDVNLRGMSFVTRAVLPVMLRKKKGCLLNLGSGSSLVLSSYPLFAVYAATKGYVAMFSRSLSVEYKRFGIDIQCQVPLLVATKMSSIRKPSFFVPSPEQFSKACIRWIGYDSICVPYWTHALQWWLMDLLPESFVNWILLRYFLDLRKKLIQKELRQKK
ncbi:hypothetical protein vseg_015292 [Gypsophila vaccaria]